MDEREGRGLVVSGETADLEAHRAALRGWLADRARERLSSWVASLAQEHGFRFDKVTVRHQKTRWGSCSPRGRISLNLKLLFLPDDLVRHVLVHELCHTVHLDHSSEFWSLVGRYEPDFKVKRSRLRDAWQHVPRWLESESA